MIFNKKNNNNFIFKLFWDINSFRNYFNEFYKFIFFEKNFKNINLLAHVIKLNVLCFEIKKLSSNFNNTWNKKTKENENFLKIEEKYNLNKILNFSQLEKNILFFNKKQNNPFFAIFSTFNFLYSFTSFDYFARHNHFFHFFHFKNYKKNFLSINLNKFLNRWKNSQNLIFAIYYYEFNPFIFGSFDYKNEILALNWNDSFFDFKLWKYCCNFFIFKINKYGEKVFFFYNKLLNFDISFFIISNSAYHYKNLYYFNRLKIFTVGLVNSNFSPWLITYPIPSISTTNLTEYFFLKLLLLFYKNVLFFKYANFKKNWFSYVMFLKTKTIVSF